MKKITALLFATFIFFATFVSAQDTAKDFKPVTYLFSQITVVKDGIHPVDKAGNYELTFSSTPGIIFFRDRDKESLVKIVLGDHVMDTVILVWVGKTQVPATVLCFMGTTEDMNIMFSTVLLNNKEHTVYGFGIVLDQYSLLFRVEKTEK